MKLVRWGEAGTEQAGLVDDSGTLRDLSGTIADWSWQTLTPETLAQVVRGSAKAQVVKKPAMPIGSHVEMSSEEERRRFEEMGPITRNEAAGIDFDELARRLQD